MMKFWIAITVLLLSLNSAFCQLKITKKSKVYLTKSEDDIRHFLSANHFDYALTCWYTSNWVSIEYKFFCLIKQRNNWYLAIINKTAGTNPVFTVKQHKLNKAEVDSVLQLINPSQAFKYSQRDFDKLPDLCDYDVVDASTYNLMQLSNKEFKILEVYNPDSFLKNCYPSVAEFGILKGFVNAVDQLYQQTKNLQH